MVEHDVGADMTPFGESTQFVETQIADVVRRVQQLGGAKLASERHARPPEDASGGQLPVGPVFPYWHVGASPGVQSLELLAPRGGACQPRTGVAEQATAASGGPSTSAARIGAGILNVACDQANERRRVLSPEGQRQLDPHLRAPAVEIQVGVQLRQETSAAVHRPQRRRYQSPWGAQ